MSMQTARIWYSPGSRTVSLDLLAKRLSGPLNCTVERAEWQMDDTIVPQLRITSPATFLIQLNNDDYVAEEAIEQAAYLRDQGFPPQITDKLRNCTRRLEIGEGDVISSTDPATVFAGWTPLDPAEPALNRILTGLTSGLDGVFEDNVNGKYALTKRPKKTLLQRLTGRG
jgi:hypothetical protein